jgi:predicted nucleic acid-binding Zn finger protein
MSRYLCTLPGMDRKQTPSLYQYRTLYEARSDAVGCVVRYEVRGGREVYQLDLERDEAGQLRWHCSCADASFRGALDPHHRCKHLRGLLTAGQRGRPEAA